MNTQSVDAMPPTPRREGMRHPSRDMIRDCLALVSLLVPSFFISVAIFVVGFVIIPSTGSDPSVHARFGDYTVFTEAAMRVQDLALFVLPSSVIAGSIARFLGARLPTAIRIVFTLNGIYWGALLAIYITALLAGVFVLPFR